MLVTPPFGASSKTALWRAYSKPPVELVVADLHTHGIVRQWRLLSRLHKAKYHVNVRLDMDELDLTAVESKAKHAIIERENSTNVIEPSDIGNKTWCS